MTVEAYPIHDTTKAQVRAVTTDIAYFAWVYDPEGNKLELWEPK